MTTLQPLDRPTDPKPGKGGGDGGGPTASETASAASWRDRLPELGPILPARLRPTTRPMPWLEIALIGISYYIYSLTRLAAEAGKAAPYNRGYSILHLEHTLHIDFEYSVNHAVNSVTWLIVGMNYYYSTLHFIVPVAVLIWVYWKYPDRYRAVRTVIFAVTGLALIGFFFYALCPPRLLIPAGLPNSFVDTIAVHGIWGQHPGSGVTSDGVGGLSTSVTNQFAAMPSLHIGWSTWCALTIAHLAQRRWVKVLGVLYPCATFVVIISTANHYVLDAVFGLVTLAAGFLLTRLLLGRQVYAAVVPDAAAAGSPQDAAAGPTGGPGASSSDGDSDGGPSSEPVNGAKVGSGTTVATRAAGAPGAPGVNANGAADPASATRPNTA